jgi:hypothetical protein
LPAGHAVGIVIEQNNRHINIAPGGVDEMVAAYGCGIAVACYDKHFKTRFGEFYACGERNGPAVRAVNRIKIKVTGSP